MYVQIFAQVANYNHHNSKLIQTMRFIVHTCAHVTRLYVLTNIRLFQRGSINYARKLYRRRQFCRSYKILQSNDFLPAFHNEEQLFSFAFCIIARQFLERNTNRIPEFDRRWNSALNRTGISKYQI